MKKLFISYICFLLFSCIGCTEVFDDFFPHFHDKVFAPEDLSFCTIPVSASVSSQSQTHPSICYMEGKWNGYDHWIATTPYPGGNAREENPCIYFANSGSNGPPVHFTGIDHNPILKPPGIGYNSDVELFFFNNCLYSLTRVCCNGPARREIKVQKSLNGFDWGPPIQVYSDKDCQEKDELSPSIIQYMNKLRIYHLNGDAHTSEHGKCTSIEIMEGTNLDNPDFKWLDFGCFTNKDSVKIEPWHIDLFEYNNKLYMVFCGQDLTERKSRLNTYLSVSDDYKDFRIFPKPLIRDFDTYRPTAYVDENGFFNLYFSIIGYNGADHSDRSVGLARMKMEELLSRLNQ